MRLKFSIKKFEPLNTQETKNKAIVKFDGWDLKTIS